MSEPQRIGVLGGTFDPIHNTHLEIARAALEQAQLDRILFVVSNQPPHKQGGPVAPAEDRFAMAAGAVEEEPRFEASRIELDREGPSFTITTLRDLRAAMPGAELFLILGMDALVDFPRWREPEAILDLARLLAAPRPGVWEPDPSLEGRYQVLTLNQSAVSSTEVRRRIREGAPLDLPVPPSVARIIEERGLYRAPASHSARG